MIRFKQFLLERAIQIYNSWSGKEFTVYTGPVLNPDLIKKFGEVRMLRFNGRWYMWDAYSGGLHRDVWRSLKPQGRSDLAWDTEYYGRALSINIRFMKDHSYIIDAVGDDKTKQIDNFKHDPLYGKMFTDQDQVRPYSWVH